MNSPTMQQNKVHHGRNIRRFREMLCMKQDVLAEELGLSQQTISRFETTEILDDDILNKIAKALKVSVEAIKNLSDDVAVQIISNTFNEQSIAYQYNFNPIDKIVELYERVIKEKEEKIALFERLQQKDKK